MLDVCYLIDYNNVNVLKAWKAGALCWPKTCQSWLALKLMVSKITIYDELSMISPSILYSYNTPILRKGIKPRASFK